MKKCIWLLSIFCLGPIAQAADMGSPQIILPKLSGLDQIEVRAGQVGRTKACHPPVAQYAAHLQADHAMHLQKVQQLAQALRVNLNYLVLTPTEQRTVNQMKLTLSRLQNTQGCGFDHEFLVAMRDAHAFAIQSTTNSITRANGAQLQAFLRTTLTALRLHYNQAVVLLRTVH